MRRITHLLIFLLLVSGLEAQKQTENVLVDGETAKMLTAAVKKAKRDREARFLAKILIGWEDWHKNEVLSICSEHPMVERAEDGYTPSVCRLRHNLTI